MPWRVARSDQCPASKPWAVIKDADGEIEGCHVSHDAANAQLGALYASEPHSPGRMMLMARAAPFLALPELREQSRDWHGRWTSGGGGAPLTGQAALDAVPTEYRSGPPTQEQRAAERITDPTLLEIRAQPVDPKATVQGPRGRTPPPREGAR